MNLLSAINWRAVTYEQPSLVSGASVSALEVLEGLRDQRLIDLDIRDLHEDPTGATLLELLKQCVLAVSEDADHWSEVTEPAVPIERRPRTWLEAHGLGDGRWLVIPGERMEIPTFSFWNRDPIDGRPTVVSFVADQEQRISGVLFQRHKHCQEEFDRTGICVDIPGGCACELSQSIDGTIVVDICECR